VPGLPELNLILLGPPGSGKGTQGERLQEDFRLPYYATGDILRAAVKEGTEVGQQAKEYMDRGDLVPDEVIIGVILDRLAEPDTEDGFLLDGFPRTDAQAEALDGALRKVQRAITAVLLIDVPEDELVRRLSGRRVCPNGHTYHLEHNPPKNDELCDVDGEPLKQRDDDREETVRKRLDVYHKQTEPLVQYYSAWAKQGGAGAPKYHRVDGLGKVEEVRDRIFAALG